MIGGSSARHRPGCCAQAARFLLSKHKGTLQSAAEDWGAAPCWRLPDGVRPNWPGRRPRVSRHLLHRTITADGDHVTSDLLGLPEEGILCVYT